MLKKMGWNKGKSLGQSSQGIAEPVSYIFILSKNYLLVRLYDAQLMQSNSSLTQLQI